MSLPNPTDLSAVRAWLAVHRPDPNAVAGWARPALDAGRRAGPLPPLGGPAWRALADDDPRKLAAALVAALARINEFTPAAVAMRLWRELRAEDRAVADRLKAASVALSTAQDWRIAAYRPSYAELESRRARPAPDHATDRVPAHTERPAA